MLQDLDALSERIRQAVALVRTLKSEQQALKTRLHSLEQQHQAVQGQLAQEQSEYLRMSEQAARYDQELQAIRDESNRELQAAKLESSQVRATLEAQVQDYQVRTQALQDHLARVQAERDRLSQAAAGAQQQIELILERLPGAEG